MPHLPPYRQLPPGQVSDHWQCPCFTVLEVIEVSRFGSSGSLEASKKVGVLKNMETERMSFGADLILSPATGILLSLNCQLKYNPRCIHSTLVVRCGQILEYGLAQLASEKYYFLRGSPETAYCTINWTHRGITWGWSQLFVLGYHITKFSKTRFLLWILL